MKKIYFWIVCELFCFGLLVAALVCYYAPTTLLNLEKEGTAGEMAIFIIFMINFFPVKKILDGLINLRKKSA